MQFRRVSEILTCFAISLLWQPPCFGDISKTDCQNVDYSKKFGEVRTSGGAEWCWANVAADMIGYAQGVNPPDRISTIDVALAHLSTKPTRIREILSGLNTAELEPLAPWFSNTARSAQDAMKNQSLYKITSSPAAAILSYQNRAGLCLERDFSVVSPRSKTYIKDYIELVSSRIRTASIASTKQNCNQDAGAQTLQNFSNELNQIVLSQMEQDLQNQCKRQSQIKPMLPGIIDLKENPSRGKATDYLKMGLKNGMPVAIGLNANVLTGGPLSTNQDHAVIVTASRWNEDNQRCEFKARDSNGTDCNIYKSSLIQQCEGGYVWLSEQEINNSTQMIMVIYNGTP
jgi:hypothetical protein